MIIPFWLKIVGPLAALLLLVAGIGIWGNSKFKAGKKQGEDETHAIYKAASDKLLADAAKSASRADDAAAKRVVEEMVEAKEDHAAVEKAKADGTSPLDALFGGNQ